MNKVYGYTRVSTVKQGTHGVSLQEQRAAIERYAQTSSLNIVEWFEETQTAAKRGRPLFTQMLHKLKRGDVSGVIIHKIDRSARNLKDWADLGELIDSGVAVHFANESLDMHSRGGRLSADIQAVIAADYIRNLKEETRKGFYGRLKQGIYPLPAPTGYLDQGAGKPKIPDPKIAPIVRHAFELYGTGTINTRDLCKKLHDLGLRNRYGNRISQSRVSTLLRNPFYIGLIRLKSTGEVFEGKHEPLITKTLFDRVQGVMDGRYSPLVSKHRFLFQKLIRCGECQHYLVGELQKAHTYYRCHTTGCQTSLREDRIDLAIKKVFDGLEMTEPQFTDLTKRLASSQTTLRQQREKQVEMLHLDLRKLQDRENRLTDAYIDQVIDKIAYTIRKNTLLLERKDIEYRITFLSSELGVINKRIQEFFERVKTLYLTYESGFREEKREILKNVSSNRLVRGKKVEITLYSPYAEYKKYQICEVSPPCRGSSRTFDDEADKFMTYLKKYYEGNKPKEN